MTELQERFAVEYCLDLNATAAYLRVRPKTKATTAASNGWRLLRNAEVQKRIQSIKAAQVDRLLINADRVLQELAVCGFSDTADYVLGAGGRLELAPAAHPLASRALASVKHKTTTISGQDVDRTIHEVEYRLWDKPGSLKALGEHLKLFKSDGELAGCEIILGEGEEVRLIVRGRK